MKTKNSPVLEKWKDRYKHHVNGCSDCYGVDTFVFGSTRCPEGRRLIRRLVLETRIQNYKLTITTPDFVFLRKMGISL